MTRWIALLLLAACAAVTLAEEVIPEETCQALAAQIKEEGKRADGPKHWFCKNVLTEKKNAYCNCAVVPRKRELDLGELLSQGKANSFLSSSDINKRGLEHECCDEGCYWEEIEERC